MSIKMGDERPVGQLRLGEGEREERAGRRVRLPDFWRTKEANW